MAMNVKIIYCRPCGYQGRAIKLADDVLRELVALGVSATLVPGSGGIFDVYINERLAFSRHKEGRFPENGEIINAVRAAAP